MEHGRSLAFHSIPTEKILRDLYEFDRLAYGDAGISWDLFLNWWKAYPQGLYGAFQDDRVIGAIGMWPVRSMTYAMLVEGTISENELTAKDFVLNSECKRHWYVSGIVLQNDFRRSAILGSLIFSGIDHLSFLANLERIDICALASSEAGRRILLRFGFISRGKGEHSLEIFEFPDFHLETALGDKSENRSDVPNSAMRMKFPNESADLVETV